MKLHSILLACASGAFGAGFAVFLLQTSYANASSGGPKEIIAQEFRLVDAAGNCKGAFSTDPNGCPMLMLSSGNGFGILLHVERNGARSIRIFSQENSERLRLRVDDEVQGFAVFDRQAKPRLTLGMFKENTPVLLIGGSDTASCSVKVEAGDARVTLANPKCKGSVDLVAAPDTAQVTVGAARDKNIAALVYSDDLTPRARIGVVHDGEGNWEP